MNLSILYITADKFYGKAYRKVFDRVESVAGLFDVALNEPDIPNSVEVWFVDKSEDYIELVKSEKDFVEIHVGRDLTFDYRPLNSGNFKNQIMADIALQIPRALALITKSEINTSLIENTVNKWINS